MKWNEGRMEENIKRHRYRILLFFGAKKCRKASWLWRKGKKMCVWKSRAAHQFQNSMNSVRARHNDITQKYVHKILDVPAFRCMDSVKQMRERKKERVPRERTRSHSSQLSNKLIWVLSRSILYAISCLYLFFLLLFWYFQSFRLPISCGVFVYYRKKKCIQPSKYFKTRHHWHQASTFYLKSTECNIQIFKAKIESAVSAEKFNCFDVQWH